MTIPEHPTNHSDNSEHTNVEDMTWAQLHPELTAGREANLVIERALDDTSRRRVLRRLEEGYARFGVPFAAFLRLDDIAITDDRLIERFEDVYARSFATTKEAIDNELEGLGWEEALTEFCIRYGVDPAFLDWNYAELETLINQLYSVVELDGWIHLFYR